MLTAAELKRRGITRYDAEILLAQGIKLPDPKAATEKKLRMTRSSIENLPLGMPSDGNQARRRGRFAKQAWLGHCRGSLGEEDIADVAAGDLSVTGDGLKIKLEPPDADEYPAGLDCSSQDLCEGAQDNSLPSSPTHRRMCASDSHIEDLMKTACYSPTLSRRHSPIGRRDRCLTIDTSFSSPVSQNLSPSRRATMSPKASPGALSKQFVSPLGRARSPIGGVQTRSTSKSPSRSPIGSRSMRSSLTELCDASPPPDPPATCVRRQSDADSTTCGRRQSDADSTVSNTGESNCSSSSVALQIPLRMTRHSRDSGMPRLKRETDISPPRPTSLSPERLPIRALRRPSQEKSEMPVLIKEEISSDDDCKNIVVGCMTRLRRSSGPTSHTVTQGYSSDTNDKLNGSLCRVNGHWVKGMDRSGLKPEGAGESSPDKKSPSKRRHRQKQYNAQLIEQHGHKVPKLTIRMCHDPESDTESSDTGSSGSAMYEVRSPKSHRSPRKKKSKKRTKELEALSDVRLKSPAHRLSYDTSQLTESPPMKRLRLKFGGDAIDIHIPSE